MTLALLPALAIRLEQPVFTFSHAISPPEQPQFSTFLQVWSTHTNLALECSGDPVKLASLPFSMSRWSRQS